MTLEQKALENIVGKGEALEKHCGKRENAGNRNFPLFSQCFLPFSKPRSNFSFTFNLSSANALNMDHSKILSFGKEFFPQGFLPFSKQDPIFHSHLICRLQMP